MNYYVLDSKTLVKVDKLPPNRENFLVPDHYRIGPFHIEGKKISPAFAEVQANFLSYARSLPPIIYQGSDIREGEVYEMGAFREEWQVRERNNEKWEAIDFFTYVLVDGQRDEFETRTIAFKNTDNLK